MTIATRIRDWYRGYSDDDVAKLAAKMAQPPVPGGVIQLSAAEVRVLTACATASARSIDMTRNSVVSPAHH